MALRGLLFDLDGVLVDSVHAWHRTIDQGARRRGLPGVSWERFAGTFGQGVDADQRSFFPTLSVDEVFELYNEEFLEHTDAVELMPGALELLDELRARSLGAAVVTNTPRPLAERVLAHTGIGERVQALAAGGDGPEKPDPGPVYQALEALGLRRDEVLYVGDSSSDAGATEAAGVRFVGRGYDGPERVETLPELWPLLDAAGALPVAPAKVLDHGGAPRFGLYRGAIADTSLAALRLPAIGERARAGQKRWSYVGVYGPRLIAACCVIDLTYLASCFAFAFDRQTGRLVEHHRIGPRLWPCVPDTPCAGHARYGWPRARATISADGLGRRAGCDLGRGAERLRFDAWLDEREAVGLSLVAPQGRGGDASSALGMTYKLAGVPVEGTITIGDERFELADHQAVVDYTHGLPPRDTRWLWASGCGRCADGAPVAFNCVSGWNDEVGLGGENAAWIDGELRPLSPLRFERPSELRWQLRGPELALDFEREAQREQHVDLKLIASSYTQPLGRFSGWILDGRGRKRELAQALGVTEDHRARW